MWNKLDEEHQLEALEIITKGHRFEVSTDIAPLVEELFDFLAEFGHYTMEYDKKTKKYKFIQQK